jgi:hypothetical protein
MKLFLIKKPHRVVKETFQAMQLGDEYTLEDMAGHALITNSILHYRGKDSK